MLKGMNWVDLVIIVLLISAVIRGLQAGLVELSLSFGGLVLGLFIGSRLARLAAVHFSSPTYKLLVVLVIELGLAGGLWAAGLMLSRRFKPPAARRHLTKLNALAGGVLEVLFSLAIIWIAVSGLSNVGSYTIGSSVRHSFIIKKLDSILPAPPDALAQLEKIVSPNGFPNVFLGFEPQHTTISPKNKVNNQAVLADEQSVVKVQGVGCGEVVYGSGFVVGKGLVVTNAHVVAGLKRPQVVDGKKTYVSVPVWFDPNLDIAILKVTGLPDAPLVLSTNTLPNASAAATLGFPGGGSLVAQDGVIIDHVTAVGRNIYNRGVVSRDVYEIQASVQPGDSGGPLVAPDGTVAGVI
jgi:S1-C subfamily serine protease